jgi:hypothetical protein
MYICVTLPGRTGSSDATPTSTSFLVSSTSSQKKNFGSYSLCSSEREREKAATQGRWAVFLELVRLVGKGALGAVYVQACLWVCE